MDDLCGWVERGARATPCAAEAADAQVVCLAWAASFLLMAARRREADAPCSRIVELVGQLPDPDPQALALVHQARAARASVWR